MHHIFRDIGAIIINVFAGVLFLVAGRLTKYQRSVLRVDPAETGMQLITPIEPSECSGGGKAVKELLELLSKHLSVRLISLPSIFISISRIEKKTAEIMMSGIPVQNTSAKSLFAGSAVERALIPGTPVFLEFTEGATFLLFRKRLNCFTILREHEVLLRRFERTEGTPKSILNKIREASSVYMCKSFLNNIYEKVDVIVTMTKEDGAYIRKQFQSVAGKIVTIPVVFDSPSGETIRDDSMMKVFNKKHARDLLFLGNLYHRPNLEALEWFLLECAPHLDRGFTLHLCGMDGPINNIMLPENHITIIRHGYIEDIESKIGWVRIGVSPVISGGGTRIKNLYLGSTGRVVVTTPLGNEGIGYRDGEEALIISSGLSMARALNTIAKEPDRIMYIGNNASRKIKEEFSSEIIWKYYLNGVFNQQMLKTG